MNTRRLRFGIAGAILMTLLINTKASHSEDDIVFPAKNWELATPESQSVDSVRLETAINYLKSHTGADGVGELVIVRRGRLIWQGENVDKVHNVWSCTKSFTSTILGLLIDDKKCELDTRAAHFVPTLDAEYASVTLQHLTTMTSGYQAVGDEGQASHGQSPTPFSPSHSPLFWPPGSKYAYWDSAQNQFGQVLTHIAQEPLSDLFRRRIADPIGMDPDKWKWGNFGAHDGWLINGGAGNKGTGISISAHEMARFGHLMLNLGRWNDRQLLSQDWVRQATRVQVPATLPLGHPQSGIVGPGYYGFNWWTNGVASDGERLWDGVPAGAFAASGHNNNKCMVVPEWNMVIVRLGLDQADHRTTDEEWAAFLRLIGEAIDHLTES